MKCDTLGLSFVNLVCKAFLLLFFILNRIIYHSRFTHCFMFCVFNPTTHSSDVFLSALLLLRV